MHGVQDQGCRAVNVSPLCSNNETKSDISQRLSPLSDIGPVMGVTAVKTKGHRSQKTEYILGFKLWAFSTLSFAILKMVANGHDRV